MITQWNNKLRSLLITGCSHSTDLIIIPILLNTKDYDRDEDYNNLVEKYKKILRNFPI
ncbi:hypothetical protein GCM10007905_38110 [Mixta theicola]|nr:hypothetical protein GCM10007905_38110 [Mixta theicola]